MLRAAPLRLRTPPRTPWRARSRGAGLRHPGIVIATVLRRVEPRRAQADVGAVPRRRGRTRASDPVRTRLSCREALIPERRALSGPPIRAESELQNGRRGCSYTAVIRPTFYSCEGHARMRFARDGARSGGSIVVANAQSGLESGVLAAVAGGLSGVRGVTATRWQERLVAKPCRSNAPLRGQRRSTPDSMTAFRWRRRLVGVRRSTDARRGACTRFRPLSP